MAVRGFKEGGGGSHVDSKGKTRSNARSAVSWPERLGQPSERAVGLAEEQNKEKKTEKKGKTTLKAGERAPLPRTKGTRNR